MKIIYVNCGVKKLFEGRSSKLYMRKESLKKILAGTGFESVFKNGRGSPQDAFLFLTNHFHDSFECLSLIGHKNYFLCPVNRRPESIALLYLKCKLDCSPYRVPGSSRKAFFEKSSQVKMWPKKAKEMQQFCSTLAKQNKTKNAPTEVIRLWTDRKDIRKHQSTSRLGHYNSARLLYQFRSILMCHEGELMFNNKIKLT